ncbi:GTPase IMAP family member 8-like isoform X2 [Embiotoca jacksoni]
MAVISTVEEWSSLRSLLQDSSGDECLQLTFSSLGSNQVCDLTVEGHSISLHYADLHQDMTEESISQALESCFKSCKDRISKFLLLIRGGYYTKREQRMIEILQEHFGAEALKYLVILSVDNGKVVDTLDDTLLDLINVCDGRYCRITSSAASDGLYALLEMVKYNVTGDTETMLTQGKRRSKEDSAMSAAKQRVVEAEEKEQAFEQLVQQQERRRAGELEELKARHAEERKKEAADKMQFGTKRESLEEAVKSRGAMLHLPATAADDDEMKELSVVLLGMIDDTKSSALNVILERAGNRYSVSRSSDKLPPILSCERKEVFAAGRRLILVNTPPLDDEYGVFDVELVKDFLALALPGPHVFLLVFDKIGLSQGEEVLLRYLQKLFGQEFAERAIILFIYDDDDKRHKPQRVEDYVAEAPSVLQDLIRKYGSRYYELNIAKSQNASSYPQVKDLLSGMIKLAAAHGGQSFSVKKFPVQKLQERSKLMQDRENGETEVGHLLSNN